MKQALCILFLVGVLSLYGCGTVAKATSSGGSSGGSGTPPTTPITPTAAVTLTVAVSPSAACGTVTTSPNGTTFTANTVVHVTAVANSGYVFDHWEDALTSNISATTITMDTNKTLTAVFSSTVTPPANVQIVASGIINGYTPYITLDGYSSTFGVTYSWAGPEDFTSTLQNIVVSIPGLYTLTVTNPANGGTAIATVNVEQDIVVPGAAIAASGWTLSSEITQITLTGMSPTDGVDYSWDGPDGFYSNEQTIHVVQPGDYVLTVTNPVNGMSSTASGTVNIVK